MQGIFNIFGENTVFIYFHFTSIRKKIESSTDHMWQYFECFLKDLRNRHFKQTISILCIIFYSDENVMNLKTLYQLCSP